MNGENPYMPRGGDKAKTISKKRKATNDNVASGIAKKRKSMSNGKENKLVNDTGKGKGRERGRKEYNRSTQSS